jgi:cation transport ATPase
VKLQEEGKTAIFVAIDGKPSGILTVADPIKSTTPDAIIWFRSLGLELVMLKSNGNSETPDLSEVEICIAMGTGTDVAMESAGIAGASMSLSSVTVISNALRLRKVRL